jgi:hypothetical protein
MIDETISKVALQKFLHHLWYLSPEAVAFSFFDNDISPEIKEKMRQKLQTVQRYDDESDESEDELEHIPCKKITIKFSEVENIVNGELDQFVCHETKIFFTRFNIDLSFMNEKPSEWSRNDVYQREKKVVEKIKVTNDTAERGVKLIEEYNSKLSTKEEQKQFILQIVSAYRKQYPDCRKQTLI